MAIADDRARVLWIAKATGAVFASYDGGVESFSNARDARTQRAIRRHKATTRTVVTVLLFAGGVGMGCTPSECEEAWPAASKLDSAMRAGELEQAKASAEALVDAVEGTSNDELENLGAITANLDTQLAALLKGRREGKSDDAGVAGDLLEARYENWLATYKTASEVCVQ